MAAASPVREASLKNVIDQTSLKWVFVGGKGGVGKTTVSCSLAIQLSRVREKVLIISTDPAHSLSDAFGQQFSGQPELVEGFTNLYAMEISVDEETEKPELPENPTDKEYLEKLILDAVPTADGFPGMDEMNGLHVLSALVKSLEYSVVLFDTAPTGHTMRLIGLPFLAEASSERFGRLMQVFSLIVRAMGRLFGARVTTDCSKDRFLDTFRKVASHLRNPEKTTFVGVCVAEFLPLYETERLIQKLTKYGIDTHNLVVNQLYYPGPEVPQSCSLCSPRQEMQEKYLEQIDSLYQDVHVTRLPLMEDEVRGVDMLEPFSDLLLHPYTPTATTTAP